MASTFPAPFASGARLIDGATLDRAFANPQASAQNNIVAHAGGGQANATPLGSAFNSIGICASTNDSVVLPLAISGTGPVTVYNATGQNLAVYPKGSDTINSGTSPLIVLAGTTVLLTCVPGSNWTSLGQFVVPYETSTSISTIGNGTLTAIALTGGIIVRSGPSSAFTDTTDTAANIIAAIPNAFVGEYVGLFIENTTNFYETLQGGLGVTISGITSVPPNSQMYGYVIVTSGTTVTVSSVTVNSPNNLPVSQFSTGTTVGTFAITQLTGANFTVYTNTVANPGSINSRTALQMVSDIPNSYLGQSWMLRIINGQGTGVLTAPATGVAGVTVTGTNTIATNTWRDYQCSITNLATPAITMQNVGTGTFS